MKSLSSKGYFLLPNGQKSSAIHKVEKDDLKVKVTKSAFTFFMKDNLAKTAKDGEMKTTEAMKLLSVKWSAMSDAEKKPYIDKQEVDKIRHD